MIGPLIAVLESVTGRAKGQVEKSNGEMEGAVKVTKGKKEDAEGLNRDRTAS